MFVTQAEIEARLASDENLLYLLTHLTPLDVEKNNKNTVNSEADKDSYTDEPSSAISLANSICEPGRSETREIIDDDNDVKLERILNEVSTGESHIGPGRPNGHTNRSTEQRADIALMGTVLGHTIAGNVLGISSASGSLHSRGLVSHGDVEDADLVKVVKRKLNKIRDRSATALIRVLDNADSNQLYDHIKTAKDAVFVANGLASVIQKVNPQEQETKATAQFVIIQPTVKTVEQYDVINV